MADLTVTKANRRDRKSTQQTVREVSPHICTKVWEANVQQIFREANRIKRLGKQIHIKRLGKQIHIQKLGKQIYMKRLREANPQKTEKQISTQQIFRDRIGMV